MSIVCPHCYSDVDANPDTATSEVMCPSCGSSFRLGTPSTVAWKPEDDGRMLGPFYLLNQVGAGAFGTVFRARDSRLDRIVAIKVPRVGELGGPEEIERLEREARSAAQLSHPGIVPVYEVGRHENIPYLVSEFVQGVTLADLLTSRKMSFREAATLITEIARALQFAHEQGVVHRDIKPGNIMLEYKEEGHRARLMDFGLARRDAGEATLTVEGQVLGTPAYMSPEQARGDAHKVDGRSDVYSVGVILYQLLTGEPPFRGNARMLVHQVLRDDPRRPRSLNDRIPRDLETICLKAMEKEPSRRYATAGALADDLERFLSDQPIQARPPSAWYRLRKFTSRHRVLVGGVTATIVTLLLGITATSAALWQAKHENEKAIAAGKAAAQEAANARESERKRIAELVNTHQTAARLSSQRGQWQVALDHYQKALDLKPDDDVPVHLGRIECWLALYQFKTLRPHLDALIKRDNLGPHRAQVLLLQGYVRFMQTKKDKSDPLEPVREAVKLGLSPAEDAFARALLHENALESLALLEKCIRIDPFHRRAYDLLPMFYFLLGRMAELRDSAIQMRMIAPNSFTSQGYEIAMLALQGKEAEALKMAEQVKATTGESGYAMMHLLAKLFAYLSSPDFIWGEGLSPRFFNLVLELSTSSRHLMNLTGEEGEPGKFTELAMFGLPSLKGIIDEAPFKDVLGPRFLTIMTNPDVVAEGLGRVVKKIPNGMFYHSRGMALAARGKLKEAEESLRLATVTPGFIDIRWKAHFDLLTVLMRRSWTLQPAERHKVHEECRGLLRKLARWGTYKPWALGVLQSHASALEENGLAFELGEEWLRLAPEDTAAREAHSSAALALGAWAVVERDLGALLAKNPGDVNLLNRRAVSQYFQREYPRALASILEVLSRDPKHQHAPGNLKAIGDRLREAQVTNSVLLEKVRLTEPLRLALAGKTTEAMEAAGKTVTEKEPPADTRIALACVHALASAATRADMKLPQEKRDRDADQLARSAVVHLEAVQATGGFKEPRRFWFLTTDPHLESLRQRSDFKELLKPVGMK